MVKKGLINASMTPEEIQKFLNEEDNAQNIETLNLGKEQVNVNEGDPSNKGKNSTKTKKTNKQMLAMPGSLASSSEATIYKHAVKELVPELEEQIDKFVMETRNSLGKNPSRKISTSSEEAMEVDTSDDSAEINLPLFVGAVTAMQATSNIPKPKTAEE